jgi:predicted nucleic acid-binding protein
MFEKIAKKSEFQPEQIRNTWALSRMNLKSQYTDTLEKQTIDRELMREAARLEEKYRLSYFD